MKKRLSLLLVLMLVVALGVGCANNETAETTETETTETAETTETTGEEVEEEVSETPDDYKLVLRMSHVFAPDEQLTKSTDAAAKAIFERTNGAIEIQSYPQGQLPTYKDGLEQVANGAEFISVEDPTYIGDYVPDFKALVGPFLYSEIDQYTDIIESVLVKGMIQQLEDEHRIKVLGLDYVFGFRNMMTNKEIVEPSDLQGMKIRVPGSQIFIDTINAMGATATPMAFSETISAVQQGVVDGLEGTVDAMGANGSAEVVKNVALTKHFLGVCGIYINADLFDSIPKEYQDIILEEFDAKGEEMTNLVKTNYEEQVKALEEKGIVFNEVNLPAFQETAKPVFDNIEGLSDGIYDKLVEEINN